MLKQQKRSRKKRGGNPERRQNRLNQNTSGVEERPRGKRPPKEKKTDWRDFLMEEDQPLDEL